MIYDTHAHFFTNDIARFPIDTSGARESSEELRARIMAYPFDAEHILAEWDRNGVTGGAGVQYNSCYKTDNSYLLSVREQHPERVSAVVILDPQEPETPARLGEMVRTHGVTGIRMTGFPDPQGRYPYFESEAALRTWAAAEQLGIAMVLMHLPQGRAGEPALDRVVELTELYPRLTIVLDHCGWPAVDAPADFGFLPPHLRLVERPNVLFKLTENNFRRFAAAGIDVPGFTRRLVDLYGAERIMWGSDYGNQTGSFAAMIESARAATALLSEAERRAVLHDTGERVFARKPG